MNQKIKKLGKWLLRNWEKLAEIAVVIWAVNGIMSNYSSFMGYLYGKSVEYHIVPVVAYFLSAVLILYLLKKHERKN